MTAAPAAQGQYSRRILVWRLRSCNMDSRLILQKAYQVLHCYYLYYCTRTILVAQDKLFHSSHVTIVEIDSKERLTVNGHPTTPRADS